MKIRALFAILIAAAMLFAPLAIQSGATMAMAPPAHPAQLADSGHCDDRPGDRDDGRKAAADCCVAMCTGLAVAPAGHLEPVPTARQATTITRVATRDGIAAELPTPPPRLL